MQMTQGHIQRSRRRVIQVEETTGSKTQEWTRLVCLRNRREYRRKERGGVWTNALKANSAPPWTTAWMASSSPQPVIWVGQGSVGQGSTRAWDKSLAGNPSLSISAWSCPSSCPGSVPWWVSGGLWSQMAPVWGLSNLHRFSVLQVSHL